ALMSASSFRRVKRRNSTVISEGGATRFFRLGRCSASHHSHFRNVLRVRNAASRRTTALPKLLGVLLALGGVTLICGRLLGFNSPLAFWGRGSCCWSGERGLRQRVSQGALDPACISHARGMVVDFDQIYITPIK